MCVCGYRKAAHSLSSYAGAIYRSQQVALSFWYKYVCMRARETEQKVMEKGGLSNAAALRTHTLRLKTCYGTEDGERKISLTNRNASVCVCVCVKTCRHEINNKTGEKKDKVVERKFRVFFYSFLKIPFVVFEKSFLFLFRIGRHVLKSTLKKYAQRVQVGRSHLKKHV